MRKLSEVLSSTSNSVCLKLHLFLPSTPLVAPLLLLSLLPDHQTPERGKKLVFLTARVHPGESPASFICQGKVLMLRLWPVSLVWCRCGNSLHATVQRGWSLHGCTPHYCWSPAHGCVRWIQLICWHAFILVLDSPETTCNVDLLVPIFYLCFHWDETGLISVIHSC